MKSRIIGKAVAVVVLTVLLSLVMHYYQTSRGQKGREAFLAREAERFDKHYAKPDPFTVNLIGCLLVAVPILGLYEGMAWIISKAFRGVDESNPS